MAETDVEYIARIEDELDNWMRHARRWEARAKRSNEKLQIIRRALREADRGGRRVQ